MKVWIKAKYQKEDKNLKRTLESYLNYIYEGSTIEEIFTKYKVSKKDRKEINQTLANRMAGLYLLLLAQDKKRLHDIVLKYQKNKMLLNEITPEIEGYIERL